MSAPLFTVFTPTYNRAKDLVRPYRSLARQTFRDFEWIVVDDGSTDDTEELVRSWIAEADFPIRYFRQANMHKKVAFNRGVRHARGDLFICLDSDDELTPEALQLYRDRWFAIPEAERGEFLGLRGGTVRPSGEPHGSTFSADLIDGNWLEVMYKEHWVGENLVCERTELLRQNPFPEDIAGYVPEAVVQNRLAARYKTRMFNDVVRIYYDSSDSISSYPNPMKTGVEGPALWAAGCLKRELRFFRYRPVQFLKVAANYTRYHLHTWASGSRRFYGPGGPLQLLLVAAFAPVGLYLFLKDLRHARRWRRSEARYPVSRKA